MSHDSSESTKKRLQKAIDKLTNEEKRALQAFTGGLTSMEQFEELVNRIKAKKLLLEQQLQKLEELNVMEAVDINNLNNVCESLYFRMRHADNSLKRQMIKSLIISIYVKERSKALVNGRIPLMTQGQNIQNVLISRDSWFTKCWEVNTF